LVRNVAKHLGNRLRIEVRAVGCDAPQHQASPLNRRLKGAEEGVLAASVKNL
jgi:hypothetical protein